MNEAQYEKYRNMAIEISKQLSNFTKYLKKSEIY